MEVIHYLDDFLLVDVPDIEQCEVSLRSSLDWCGRLGIPVVAHKIEGPAVKLMLWGIKLDIAQLAVPLPEGKLTRLQGEIRKQEGKQSCSKRDLLSLIGQLQYAYWVVRPACYSCAG